MMRMLMIIRLPTDTFNAAVLNGSAGPKTAAILDEVKPETVYFSETGGQRTVFMVVDLKNPSGIPALAEPWYLTFSASVEFHVVMNREELQVGGLDELGGKWA